MQNKARLGFILGSTGWIICSVLALVGGWLVYRGVATGDQANVIITWSTGTEIDTVGFNLYRSDNPEGPFTRVNDRPIAAASDPLLGGSYTYTDTEVVADTVYYYQLEDIEADGTITRQDPTISVQASSSGRSLLLSGVVLLIGGLIGAGLLYGMWRETGSAETRDP